MHAKTSFFKVRPALQIALAASVLAFVGGCSSTKPWTATAERAAAVQKVQDAAEQARLERKQAVLEQRMKAVPKWALEPVRRDADAVYAVGFGDSDKLNVALKKAMLDAEFGLAKQYRRELSGSERSATVEGRSGGVAQNYTQLIDSLVASVPMAGVDIIEQEVKPVQGQYSAWVLLRLSYDQMTKLMAAEPAVLTNDDLKRSFDELERRVRERNLERARAAEAMAAVKAAGALNGSTQEGPTLAAKP